MDLLSLATLLKYWKEVVLGIVVIGSIIYVGTAKIELSHYKSKTVVLQAKIDALETRAKVAETLAVQRADEITQTHKDALRVQNELLERNDTLVQQNIKANEELKHIKLSLNLIQLWNSSKQPNADTATAKQGNATEASPPKASVTLEQLFAVSAENDSNHLKCIKQVEEWINFWQEYQKTVEEVNGVFQKH